ncbi:MATE family efflux transporter [Candidatus Sororendozoicomonas aggregata]|uniref:MATE family efflux transporter n=1 Tax=Candidatus Sororendozoicomonas aggregata TaxID=3073239 RepID=UPI002ED4DA3D
MCFFQHEHDEVFLSQTFCQRAKTILHLGIPMIIAMVSQSLLNLVDAALVGPLGKNALAAVGAGSNALLVALAFVAGVSSGVQAQVARRMGTQLTHCAATPVNHGMVIAFVFGLPVSIFLCLIAPWIMQVYQVDPATKVDALLYFQIRVMTLTAAVLNLAFRGYWNGTRQPHCFLKNLLISHLFNAAASYCLIYGKADLPALGVAGAAIGTFLSMYLCALLNLYDLRRCALHHGLFTRWGNRLAFFRLIKLATPDSVQQVLFSLAIMLFFVIISYLGAEAIAISHVLISLSLFLILPGLGLGVSVTTLVSQSLGASKPDEALQWGKDGVVVAIIVLIVLGLPFILAPNFFLSWFFHDDHLLMLARLPLQLLCLGIIIDTAALVLSRALLGAGANRSVLVIRFFFQWCVLLPLVWLVGPVLGWGLSAVWGVQALQKFLSSLTFIIVWHQKRWIEIDI